MLDVYLDEDDDDESEEVFKVQESYFAGVPPK
jgi:hypothetical protein